MTNSKALFYPTIEINDENWLKGNLLFWDEIKTIVPESIKNPYNNPTTALLAERGVLIPEEVNPDHYVVRELSQNVIEFLNTEEGLQLLSPSDEYSMMHTEKLHEIHHDKLTNSILRNLRLHPDKMAHELAFMMENGENDWLMVSSSFAQYYMTMLANSLCDENGLSLLTNNPLCSNLSTKVKQGLKGRESYWYRPNKLNQRLANGIFTNLVIETINFHPSTNVIDILSFKENNKDALGIYRSNIKKLVESVSGDCSLNELREEVQCIFHDEYLPSFNNLKKKLKESPIEWASKNFMKVGFYSTSATAIPTTLLGLSIPHALIAGAAASLVVSLISYNTGRTQQLRENPYNYLLEINRQL